MAEQVRVLHVDDDPDLTRLTADYLERQSPAIEVTRLHAPGEVEARLADGEFDCVVCDLEMPERSGLDVLEAVRASFEELPFILFTGEGSESVASTAISTGVTDYVQKGGDAATYEVLCNRIENAVEQYRNRRQLEASQRRLSLFFDQSPMGVIEWDDRFRFVRMNDAAEEILGYNSAELRGDGWDRVVPPSDEGTVEAIVSALLEDTGGYHSVNENVRKDGERIVCEWHNRVVTDEDGTVVAVYSLFQDVTEREARKETLELMNQVVERLNDGAVIVQDGVIEYVNPSVAELLGEPMAAIEGSPMTEYIAPEFESIVAERHDRRVRQEEKEEEKEKKEEKNGEEVQEEKKGKNVPPERYEIEVCTESGERIPVDINVSRIEYEGEPATVSLIRDVTVRKERERELQRKTERLERFASVVSHDLLNPLNVAMGHLELAREEFESDHLQTIERALDRIEELLADLTEMATYGEEAQQLEPVDLETTVRTAWENVDAPNGSLVTGTAGTVRADRSQLQQVFENLLANSVEHAEGAVTITVGSSASGFHVADDGPGIPPDERERIFDPGVTTAESGTGFGLAIVTEIVESHDWSIAVAESEWGGARFEVTDVDVIE